MKPIALSIKDYRAFTVADVNLDAVSAASITGPNGAGKSTVCESIIWSLYGEGRSSGIDQIVRLGADEASVQLDYAHNGNIFRVIRKRSRGKRSDLQYLVLDGETWKPLTGAGIRETQEKINHDLAMDGSLFLSSSCVMQGASAGICEAGPADRKRVLYQIFEDQLNKFPPLHEAAKSTLKQIDETLSASRAKRSELEMKVGERANLAFERDQAAERLKTLQQEISELEQEATSIRDEIARGQADREKLESIKRQIEDISREISELEAKIRTNELVLQEAQNLTNRAAEIREQCAQADRLEAEIMEWANKSERYGALIQQYKDKQAEFDADINRLERDLNSGCADIRDKKHNLQIELQQVQGKISSLKTDIAQAEKQAELLHEVPCNNSTMAETCKLLANAREAASRLTNLNEWLQEWEPRIEELQLLIGKREDELTAKQQEHSKALAELQSQKNTSLEDIKQQGLAVGYDPNAHKEAARLYESLKTARELLSGLAAAESKAEAANQAIAEAIQTRSSKLGSLNALLVEKDAILRKLPVVTAQDLGGFESRIQNKRAVEQSLTGQIAVTEQKLAEIQQADEQLTTLLEIISKEERRRVVFANLHQAFSRDGIPALIIDNAIPAIEEHANDILQRLSDGRMHLKMVTQKQNASGGIAETLEILVEDSAGERPYEDWSGGEKLRIDLSVRIALGRVLANRSGAKIETLILDEVCAPLDEAGEEALVDCITRLQQDFGCILLITHRESLKDRLPQQIVVSKNGHGSEVKVVA